VRSFQVSLWVVLLLPLLGGGAVAQRIPCSEVMHEINRLSGAGSSRHDDAEYLARRLKTSLVWVEKCASIYGRRLKTVPLDSDERVRREELWESEEPVEVGRDELEARGEALSRVTRERDRARQRQMNQLHQEWEPAEHEPWESNLGHTWNPYLVDQQREPRVQIPGLVTD
jgi:hypothetical protein